jgi:phage terminase large subunit-like protein
MRQRKILSYFPPTGPYRRELYQKHMQFFEAGKLARERCSLSANRVGKTESLGGYELVCHLTGQYPEWWNGRRFDRAILAWACGDTGKTVRDILQAKILGLMGQFGTGLIPAESIVDHKAKAGIADAVELVYVRHASGDISTLVFKSYDQGREAFQGNEPDVILEDEEVPEPIHHECVTRTMTNNGMVMVTYTPLEGLTPTVLLFAPGGAMNEGVHPESGRYLINITWDDVPHLTEQAKAEMLRSYPPYMRDARSKGIPQLGSGAIYPVPETEITVPDFPIPDHWPRAYAMDPGWNFTAAAWGTRDPATGVIYIYSVYKRSKAEPSIHASSIRSRGDWVPGVIDPAARGRGQRDGEQIITDYKNLGLVLMVASNAVESGLYLCWEMLSSGRLKIFQSCQEFFQEYRIYRRDDKGNVIKENDHIMDAMRYLIVSGMDKAIPKPVTVRPHFDPDRDYGIQAQKKKTPSAGKAFV